MTPQGPEPTQGPSFTPDQTIGAALTAMTRAFAKIEIDSPQRDARFLVQSLLGLDGATLLTEPQRPLGSEAPRLTDAVRRRLAHEPVSRILGSREFYGRDFIVTPGVLDPRPDTETVIDLALDIIRDRGSAERALSIADIGTGSGILIATLLAELPTARGIATDLSPAALAVARKNSERLGVADRVTFTAAPGLAGYKGGLDLIVSNPPYIATNEIPGLEPSVRDYDPIVALDGGPDGLDVYREIAKDIVKLQSPAIVVLEIGEGQAPEVEKIFGSIKGVVLGERKDLGGHIRAVALEIHS
jgi:release factor glutamine methyltransferase